MSDNPNNSPSPSEVSPSQLQPASSPPQDSASGDAPPPPDTVPEFTPQLTAVTYTKSKDPVPPSENNKPAIKSDD